ncbi:origin recognition complex subunit 2-like [Elysia marginata]|uniref:Origin recognition complex subunit 2 n=1 Tax=Elysia marginata TaxID=1093978 RepID=A0AAV4HNM7_9GAST|nr:origin recognition complex subunit 2-like [Elysia marginata]
MSFSDLSEDDDSIDESSEEDSEDDEKKNGDRFAARVQNGDHINTAASAENYFDLHAQTPVTSDRTLASLEGPRLDVDTVRSALANLPPHHPKQCQALLDSHAKLFNKWMLHMCSGFNVLLHGLGSKRNLLEQFREEHLAKFSHLVVNGYFPSLTVKHILNSITEDLLESSKGFTNPQAQLEFIKEEYKNTDEDVFLVIHNIDGVLLRSEKGQATLSQLAEIEGFHIIASLDHINAGFMWDQTKFFRFRWLWYETATFAPYEAENSYENSLLVQQSGGLALSSLAHVMRSLTPNARQIFLVLADYQLENGYGANYAGMSFQALYHKCREAFLVNSDLTLQAQLVEFKDHRLLKAKKNFEGIEHLTIPIDQGTLKEFLHDYKNNS